MPMEHIESLADWTSKGVWQVWSDYYEFRGFSTIQVLREGGAVWYCPRDFAVFCVAEPSINNLELLLEKYQAQIAEAQENIRRIAGTVNRTKSAVLKINFADRPYLQMITVEGKLGDLIELSVLTAVEYKNARKRYLRRDLLNRMLSITDDTKLNRGDVYLLEEDRDGVGWVVKLS
jgi:hypothetical protein